MKKYALIVAGGSGNRMKNDVPKQFLEISGRPVLMRTFDVFVKYDNNTSIILVLPENQIENWINLCALHNFSHPHKIVNGGETRFQSVKNGLLEIQDKGIVFIHDGVRPLVSVQTIRNCYETAVNYGNALPVIPVTESVRFSDQNKSQAVDRSKYVLVQTPQTFRTDLIRSAYLNAEHENFTDDATVLEASGGKIILVEGNRENIKITWPEDLVIAGYYFSPR